jgi:hypothetical protein
MSIAFELENKVELELDQNFTNIFPSLLQDPNVKSLFHSDLNTLNQNLPIIIEKLPFSISNYQDSIQQMRRCRDIQEQKVHDRIQNLRPIDFFHEVSKYNPDIGRAITESDSICEALARIIKESNERIQNFKKAYAFQDYELNEETSVDMHSEIKQEEDVKKEKYESDTDSLSFFDLGELKRVHSDIGLDIEHVVGEQESSDQKTKKIVLYNSSGRYVLGFDKVENLMDPGFVDDDLVSDYGRDILKEIHVNHDHHYNTYKFLNFN